MPIKPFLVISMELIQEFCMDLQSQFWASVASIKILDGSQIVILKSGMLPFPSVVHSGKLQMVETRVELTGRFWLNFCAWGNFSALGTSRLFSEL